MIFITPFWKESLSPIEVRRINISLSHNSNIKHIFVGPKIINKSKIAEMFPNSKFFCFDNEYFSSIDNYNVLLLSKVFYESFREYEYIVICQSDAIILRDLNELIDFDYDYVGAPWEYGYRISKIGNHIFANSRLVKYLPHRRIFVGNGGLSIRKVSTFLNLLSLKSMDKFIKKNVVLNKNNLNEDILFSYFLLKERSRIPNRLEANKYFVETLARKIESENGIFGVHGLEKYNPKLEEKIMNEFKSWGENAQ
jgi:hypothetical protein